MDKSQKSEETFGQSHSSSSRRVMWKVNDEQEQFDSVVNYKKMQQQQSAEQPPACKLASSAPATGSVNKKCALAYWQEIFKLIRNQKLTEELSTVPSLALRYKPSHESLKYRRSRDFAAAHQQPADALLKLNISGLKMESCSLPPQQLVAVREAAPRFAQSVPNDTDSCGSGEMQVPKNSPVVDISYASSAASNCVKLFPSNHDLLSRPKLETSSVQLLKKQANKRRSANNGKATSNNNKQSSSSGSGNGFPTLRQRQLELHRYRVQVEQRRLDLLEVKIAREREEAVHHEILFQKDLQIKENQIKSFDDSSNI